jgi:hypothetical protein
VLRIACRWSVAPDAGKRRGLSFDGRSRSRAGFAAMARSRSKDSLQTPHATPSAATTIALRATGGTRLRGPQLEFNRLTRRIETLRRKAGKERERLEELLHRFLAVVGPVDAELARRRIELARALSDAHARWTLRKARIASVRDLILSLLQEAFEVATPDQAATDLYDQWIERGDREEEDRSRAAIKKLLRAEFRAEFGFDPDIDDDGDDSRAGFERFRRKMAEQVRKADEEQARQPGGTGTSRDLGRRRREAEQEDVRVKSIRAIYLSLAKILHPDTNVEPAERARREHDMKRATEAYRQEDLLALLELERRWGTRDHDALRGLGDDVLSVYIASLRRRAKSLEREVREQMFDPRYARIAPVARLTGVRALAAMGARAEQLRGDLAYVDGLFAGLAACGSKRELARFLEDCFDGDESLSRTTGRRRLDRRNR